MKVLVVGDFPVFYDGERYDKESELVIKAEHFNSKHFEEVKAQSKKPAKQKEEK